MTETEIWLLIWGVLFTAFAFYIGWWIGYQQGLVRQRLNDYLKSITQWRK